MGEVLGILAAWLLVGLCAAMLMGALYDDER